MNLKDEITKCLARNGWKPSRLAAEAGVPQPVISRIMTGRRRGVHSETLFKLRPFLDAQDEHTRNPSEAA